MSWPSTEGDKTDLLGEDFLKECNKDPICESGLLGEVGENLPHFRQMKNIVCFLKDEIIEVLSK